MTDDDEWVVRQVTGSAATRAYRCPGCDQEIRPATPHVVAWPAASARTAATTRTRARAAPALAHGVLAGPRPARPRRPQRVPERAAVLKGWHG